MYLQALPEGLADRSLPANKHTRLLAGSPLKNKSHSGSESAIQIRVEGARRATKRAAFRPWGSPQKWTSKHQCR